MSRYHVNVFVLKAEEYTELKDDVLGFRGENVTVRHIAIHTSGYYIRNRQRDNRLHVHT